MTSIRKLHNVPHIDVDMNTNKTEQTKVMNLYASKRLISQTVTTIAILRPQSQLQVVVIYFVCHRGLPTFVFFLTHSVDKNDLFNHSKSSLIDVYNVASTERENVSNKQKFCYLKCFIQ